jgi:hypothetical protein
MIRRVCRLGLLRPCLLAALVVFGLPSLASAQGVAFRNECTAPVIVQAVAIGPRGVIRRDRPYLLNPGAATPPIMLPGDKIITIYDARVPNRILFQGTIPAGRAELHFRVVHDVAPGRVRIEPRRPARR